jgi:glycine cleavage system T protein (aminomethyltransferase)
MPVDYGSQIKEHHAVRSGAGIFDVSHMSVIDLSGAASRAVLGELLANDVAKLDAPGAALYSCMLRDDGGILDDLIAYRIGSDAFRIVSNAATRDKDLAWIGQRTEPRGVLLSERTDLALLAVQGPRARELFASAVGEDAQRVLSLAPFTAADLGAIFVARTGYTGEDGLEVAVAADEAATLWDRLLARGVEPCGLGARDTLRLEAGLNLYGADMDEHVTPYECGLGWTVARAPEQHFIGRDALRRRQAAGFESERVGLLLEERGVMRAGYAISSDRGRGVITSGGYAPTLERSIALARAPLGASGECLVSIRGRERKARIVEPPFVRRGKIVVAL